jgi:hypothetical protein
MVVDGSFDNKVAVGTFYYDLFDDGLIIPVQRKFNGVEGDNNAFFVLLEELYW